MYNIKARAHLCRDHAQYCTSTVCVLAVGGTFLVTTDWHYQNWIYVHSYSRDRSDWDDHHCHSQNLLVCRCIDFYEWSQSIRQKGPCAVCWNTAPVGGGAHSSAMIKPLDPVWSARPRCPQHTEPAPAKFKLGLKLEVQLCTYRTEVPAAKTKLHNYRYVGL